MMNSKTNRLSILSAVLLIAAVFTVAAEPVELSDLIRNALEYNMDIAAAGYDVAAEKLNYESARAGVLPKIGFTTDGGNNPLYRYSDANEFSADTFQSERYKRHKTGGGIIIDANIPTGGSLSLTGAGNLDLSLVEADGADWNYLVSPALSLYFRQPLFIDRINATPLRVDNLKLSDELAKMSLRQAELNLQSFENSLVILVARTAAVLNSLRNSYLVLEKRIGLSQKRLELARQDEQAGRVSSLDRLSEELQIRRQQEALIEIQFQIESAKEDLVQLTGLKNIGDEQIDLGSFDSDVNTEVDPQKSISVILAASAARSIELAGTAVQNGTEPVVEVSALYRRSDTDAATEIETAFSDAVSAEMDLSVSLSVSFFALDWGESGKKKESERTALLAARQRLDSARETSEIQTAAAIRNIRLIEEKFELLLRGLEYDRILLERERIRFEAGLTSEAAVAAIELDLLEREYDIRQLEDEKVLAFLELFNTGGLELTELYRQER